MINSPQIYVIVPCFNEKAVLRQTLLPLTKQKYNVIVVDDCSSDASQEDLKDLPIHYLRHSINLGQGAALQTGMEFALQKDAEIVVHFDADGQHPANEISNLIQPILDGKYDIVLGLEMRLTRAIHLNWAKGRARITTSDFRLE